ncbi:MAG: Histone H1-like nucleoprotein [Rickettsiaceae bacterium]|jgi:preprotein translocase subunit SecD|nr:Histone H1-like nucleoprotein [Rickettsiaceae bacterium]
MIMSKAKKKISLNPLVKTKLKTISKMLQTKKLDSKPLAAKPVVKKAEPAKKPVVKKAAVKKPVVKKAAVKKPVVKKATVKKASPAKKVAVKKAAVKKPVVKKATVKKASPAKKPAVKKAAVKKPVVKKAAVKKPVVKKATVKKASPAKKVAVKKPVAKKTMVKNSIVKSQASSVKSPMTMSLLGQPMNHSVDNYKNMAESNVNCIMKLCNCCNDHAEEMMKSIQKAINRNIEEATNLGHEFFKCRTAKDMVDLQQKIFEVGYKSSMKCCMDIMDSIKDLAEKNSKIVSGGMHEGMRKMF